jgi:hypothetical protein
VCRQTAQIRVILCGREALTGNTWERLVAEAHADILWGVVWSFVLLLH